MKVIGIGAGLTGIGMIFYQMLIVGTHSQSNNGAVLASIIGAIALMMFGVVLLEDVETKK